MGLDIITIKQVEPYTGDIDDVDVYWIIYQFNDRKVKTVMKDGKLTTLKHGQMVTGVYGGGDFHAGSYSGYGAWREKLAQLAGYEPIPYSRSYGDTKEFMSYSAAAWKSKGGPFWELINFSDCEGYIGSVDAAKLYKDFADYTKKANKMFKDENPYNSSYGFLPLYKSWKKVMKIVSKGGLVRLT